MSDKPPIPLGQWLIRRRRRQWITGGIAILLIAGVLITRTLQSSISQITREHALLRIESIDDSAGFLLCASPHGDDKEHHIHLLGVDSVTLRAPATLDRLRRELADQRVRVSHDATTHAADQAYVYLEDGRMINEWVIEEGWARADATSSHALTQWFGRLEGQARRHERGIWQQKAPADATP
ncbi:MAG: hypothetical protein GC162_10125 [Planctomycetes bacterium]|nr:hypothetical protein [Planctomycetota bacterium]